MKVQHRMLMYVLTRMLVPRSGNHVVVQKLDITLLWGLYKELKMNWAWIVLANMLETAQGKKMFPYPQLITKILRHFKISVVNEESVKTTLIFGESTVNQMQLKKLNGIWTRAQPNTEQAEQAETQSEVLAKLLEFMESQDAHNAKVEASLMRL